MIEYVNGDILDTRCDYVVCPVNMVGVMGAGLAAQMERSIPGLAHAYTEAIKTGSLRLGHTCAVERFNVVLFATKDHWKYPSRLEYVSAGMNHLARWIQSRGVRSIAIPALGCGLGRLTVAQVGPVIRMALAGLPDVRVELYGFGGDDAK